jgi:tRNA A37 threonylcarbamoyltransferase TsaD
MMREKDNNGNYFQLGKAIGKNKMQFSFSVLMDYSARNAKNKERSMTKCT